MRLLVSVSGTSVDAEYRKFLSGLGVPKIKQDKAIGPDHFPQSLRDTEEMREAWALFIKELKLGRIDRLEYNSAVIAAFIGQLKQAGGRPWKPGKAQKLEQFFKARLKDRIETVRSTVHEKLRSTDVLRYFDVKPLVYNASGAMLQNLYHEIQVSGILEGKLKRNQDIGTAMSLLKGSLYRGSVPPELNLKKRRKSVHQLSVTQNLNGWQHICNVGGIELKAALSSDDRLVIRYSVTIPGFYFLKNTREGNDKLLVQEWKSFRP